MLFLSRIIDGLTAGNISTLFAYISDTTKPQERSKWFGYIGAAMGIGKIGGPALGGMLGSISISLPFYLTAGFVFLSGLAVYFFLPESLAHEKRIKRLSLNSFNTFSHFKDIFCIKDIALLLVIGVLFYSGLGVFQFNFTVFLKDIYHWTPAMIGGILTFVGIFEILSRAVILPFLLKHFSEKSISVLGLSLFCSGLAIIFISIYLHSAIIIALSIIFIISGEGLFDPTYTGKLSQSVDETRQGKLQGVNQSIQSLINIIIPLAAAAIYFQSPKILYIVSAVVVSIAIIICSNYSPKKYKQNI
jgi:DHA1 family tetracycline resistance protein-like MFS transporter